MKGYRNFKKMEEAMNLAPATAWRVSRGHWHQVGDNIVFERGLWERGAFVMVTKDNRLWAGEFDIPFGDKTHGLIKPYFFWQYRTLHDLVRVAQQYFGLDLSDLESSEFYWDFPEGIDLVGRYDAVAPYRH